MWPTRHTRAYDTSIRPVDKGQDKCGSWTGERQEETNLIGLMITETKHWDNITNYVHETMKKRKRRKGRIKAQRKTRNERPEYLRIMSRQYRVEGEKRGGSMKIRIGGVLTGRRVLHTPLDCEETYIGQ
ncbi:hypothetical protein JTB14_005245 [Gonioctena quinquepunctata]|nr:hypothetical protein JTB14_005245 [Gonioctena quinquepunctata]